MRHIIMLYYILPPIIIVLSMAALIFFLFKKVSAYPQEDFLKSSPEKGRISQLFRRSPSIVRQYTLRFLEKTIHRIKLIALKFHNVSNEWVRLIRKKREQGMRQPTQMEEKENSQEKDVLVSEEQVIRPSKSMLKSDIVRPDSYVAPKQRKEQLEEVLIKRIAINPRDIEAYERLGDYYYEQSSMRDAMECYQQVLKLSPTHFKARTKVRRIEKILK
jgi:tetratricopeptide (TPR) repeat protein